jgi:hypothetical protein
MPVFLTRCVFFGRNEPAAGLFAHDVLLAINQSANGQTALVSFGYARHTREIFHTRLGMQDCFRHVFATPESRSGNVKVAHISKPGVKFIFPGAHLKNSAAMVIAQELGEGAMRFHARPRLGGHEHRRGRVGGD